MSKKNHLIPSIQMFDLPERTVCELVDALFEMFPELSLDVIKRELLCASKEVFVLRFTPALDAGEDICRLELIIDTLRISELIRSALASN